MAEVFRSTVRARGLRAAPLALATFLTASAVLLGWAEGGSVMTVTLLASIGAIVTSAGLIGNDVADGTVQLVLARALTRNEYLAGRFLGAAVLALAGGALILAGTAAGTLLSPRGRFDGPGLAAVALTLAAHLLWQTVVCFALSTFVPGRGDVVVYLLLLGSGPLLANQAADVAWPWLASAFHWWAEQIGNRLAWTGWSLGFWKDLARWLGNGAAALLLGSAWFRQREFSYGTG